MPAIFSKNCVFTGELDSYCLVCCKHLPAEHGVLAHIHDSKHQHNLSSNAYVDKLRHDCIRKVAGVYFCEFCNMTFSTTAKVGLHVTQDTHAERKRERMNELKRVGKCIVFHENILITEDAWNGLVGDTCVLCNVEFEYEAIHKSEQKHILNLIASKVTVSADSDIYRQVDGICQCLTCNKIVSEDALTEHLHSAQHKSSITKCDRRQEDVVNKNGEGEYLKYKTADKDGAQGDADVSDKSPQKHRLNTTSLTDVQPKSTDGNSLYTKPVLMKPQEKGACSTCMPKDVESLAKQHGLSVIKNDNKVYCNTCSSDVAATLHSVREHVAGRKHAGKLPKPSANKQTTTKLKKMLFQEFITDIWMVDVVPKQSGTHALRGLHVIINNTIVVSCLKFACIAKSNYQIICQICRVNLAVEDVDVHIRSTQHCDRLTNIYVITSFEGEFIRQLETDLYDCGYCGRPEHDWEDMVEHLDTDEHKRNKREYENLLTELKMSLIEDHIRHSMFVNTFEFAMNNMRLF